MNIVFFDLKFSWKKVGGGGEERGRSGAMRVGDEAEGEEGSLVHIHLSLFSIIHQPPLLPRSAG